MLWNSLGVGPRPLLLLRGGLATAPPPVDPALQDAIVSTTLYIGTVMSSLSGCISAGTKQMDLLGCVIVALITAAGGGTLRDVILGRPPFWLTYPIHLHLCIWTAVWTFLAWPSIIGTGFKDTHLAFLWSDAIGMASSAIIGAHIGLQETSQWAVAILCGVMTATFGGIMRDVLCLEPPRALYAERSMYATPALLGASCYVLLSELSARARAPHQVQWIVASVPFFIALFVRAAAWTYRLALPRWARTSTSVGAFLRGDQPQIKVQLTPAKKGPVEK